MKDFDRAYRTLNPTQKLAVDTIEGPVMVIAGPGTGKTTILTARIANILKRTDTPAHGILAITYTDAGVRAMRDKLRDIIGNRAHDVHIHTFHSFAAAMIAEYPDHFMSLDGMKTMTEVDQESLIRTILSGADFAELRPLGRPDAYIAGIMGAINDAKREALTPFLVREHANKEIKRLKEDDDSISTRGMSKGRIKAEVQEIIEKNQRTLLLADIYEKYEEKKRESGYRDFNDLIIEFLVALRRDQLLLRLIQERFLYVHVDEHQDTNDAQNFIIALIAEFFETPNIFIVGDEKQAIYRFQGASVENFFLLRKRWPAMRVISLDVNYRSHQDILDAAFSMIENNYEDSEHQDLRVPLRSGSGNAKKPVDIISTGNILAAENRLVEQLQEISRSDPSATAAVIVRRNRDLDRVIRLLESRGIAVSSERSVDIFKHPAGRVFFDLIEYIIDPARTDLLSRTIVTGMWGQNFSKVSTMIRSISAGSEENLENKLPGLKHIRRRLLSDHAVGFIIHTAQDSGFTDLIARDPAYVHVWRGIVALAESLAREGDISDPTELLKSLLAYRISAESRPVKVTVGAPDLPFRVMTAHGSKGLEFDYVFIPYATEEAWVGKPRGSSFILPKKQVTNSDIRDLRRLFYVALTRAKKHVTIMIPLEEADGRQLSPLRFISELGKDHVAHSSLPMINIAAEKASSVGIKTKDDSFTGFIKHTLMQNGLSVTALNHFMQCPNKFLYQSILKMPQAASASSEKGSAMHFALASVWKNREADDADAIETTLTEGIHQYLSDSFLPRVEKEAVRMELTEDAPAVAKALVPHFAARRDKGTVILTERWVKTNVDFKYQNISLHIPIHGKLDAVVENGLTVSVFDYKTRQSMSLPSIRGETKSSKAGHGGNYFRQLIFYRLLMAEDPRWRGRKIEPALVFVSPDKKGRCPIIAISIEASDEQRVHGEIQSLIDAVWSGKIAQAKCDDIHCEWCGLRDLVLA